MNKINRVLAFTQIRPLVRQPIATSEPTTVALETLEYLSPML